MTDNELEAAAHETRDRLLALCALSKMSPQDTLDFLHRVWVLLGRHLRKHLKDDREAMN